MKYYVWEGSNTVAVVRFHLLLECEVGDGYYFPELILSSVLVSHHCHINDPAFLPTPSPVPLALAVDAKRFTVMVHSNGGCVAVLSCFPFLPPPLG